jgi:hypothetical protein
MSTAFQGTIPMRGDLRIIVRHAATGAVHWRYEIRNTITYIALKGVVNLIAQKTTLVDPADYKVAWLRVGTGVVAPTRADTNLGIPAPDSVFPLLPVSLSLGDVEKVLSVSNPFEMKVLATLPSTEGNGLNLTEAGLFTRGGTIAQPPGEYPAASGKYPELFARQIHPAIPKSNAFVIDYDWRIAFTS